MRPREVATGNQCGYRMSESGSPPQRLSIPTPPETVAAWLPLTLRLLEGTRNRQSLLRLDWLHAQP
jgi:hypothetical protein